jgi:hypothetical protein
MIPSYILTDMPSNMFTLSNKFPEVYSAFIEGKFYVQLSQGEMLCRIENDKAIELTLNKDTKSVIETTRFSMNVNAVQRWVVNSPY